MHRRILSLTDGDLVHLIREAIENNMDTIQVEEVNQGKQLSEVIKLIELWKKKYPEIEYSKTYNMNGMVEVCIRLPKPASNFKIERVYRDSLPGRPMANDVMADIRNIDPDDCRCDLCGKKLSKTLFVLRNQNTNELLKVGGTCITTRNLGMLKDVYTFLTALQKIRAKYNKDGDGRSVGERLGSGTYSTSAKIPFKYVFAVANIMYNKMSVYNRDAFKQGVVDLMRNHPDDVINGFDENLASRVSTLFLIPHMEVDECWEYVHSNAEAYEMLSRIYADYKKTGDIPKEYDMLSPRVGIPAKSLYEWSYKLSKDLAWGKESFDLSICDSFYPDGEVVNWDYKLPSDQLVSQGYAVFYYFAIKKYNELVASCSSSDAEDVKQDEAVKLEIGSPVHVVGEVSGKKRGSGYYGDWVMTNIKTVGGLEVASFSNKLAGTEVGDKVDVYTTIKDEKYGKYTLNLIAKNPKKGVNYIDI